MANISFSDTDTNSIESVEEEECSTAVVKVVIPPPPPNYFGNIAVQNSGTGNVHFGNTTVYNGAVTVKQFVTTPPLPEYTEIHLHDKDYLTVDPNVIVTGDLEQPQSPAVQEPGSNENLTEPLISGKNVGCCGVRWTRRRVRCVLVFAVLLAVVALTLSLLLGVSTSGPADDPNWTVRNMSGAEGVAPLYSRLGWLAESPAYYIGRFPKQPISLVVILHSITPPCHNHSQCISRARSIQSDQISQLNWADIAYNFMVGGDGGAYVGRGWDLIGAHTRAYNSRSIGVCFLGNFVSATPPEQQLRAARLLVEEGVRLGKLTADYELIAHLQVSNIGPPASALYAEIRKWPHWVANPNSNIIK